MRPGTMGRLALAAVGLSGAVAVSAGAQEAQTTTVVRTRGSMVLANLTSYGDCIQRSLDVSAESSVERTRVDGTRSLGETLRTQVVLVESDVCTGSNVTFGIDWPNLDGVTWDTELGTASMSFSRPVSVRRCSVGDDGVLCETRTELLTLSMQWTGNGDFDDTIYSSRQTLDGTFRKERSRGKVLTMDVSQSVQLDGVALSFPSAYGTMIKQRRGTLTTSPL
jgi:hypothetical protein